MRPFTVGEYHRLTEIGVLTEDDPVELLEGWIVFKMPHNPRHDNTVYRLQDRLVKLLPPDWLVRVQSAMTTADSEPEPDIAVAAGPVTRYDTRHPGPEDVTLVVEVADTSLGRDRQDKLRLYARAGVQVYWIVNLVDLRVEVYTDPSGTSAFPAYRSRTDYTSGQSISLQLAGAVIQLAVAEFLP
jgi:Uma2 family endonuclease